MQNWGGRRDTLRRRGSMAAPSNQGILRVVTPTQLQEHEAAATTAPVGDEAVMSALARHVRTEYEQFSRHRSSSSGGWSERLLTAMRVFNGQYDAATLAEIKRFGGSEVYARVIAMKCRGASSLLRDVYLTPERPWALDPPADPDVPDNIVQAIESLVSSEQQAMAVGGAEVQLDQIRDRTMQLMDAARQAAAKRAGKQAKLSEARVDEILQQGNFYKALQEFLTDLPLFPFACMKGPVVRVIPTIDWSSGKAQVIQKPCMMWYRVSPFDVYWTPGASDIEGAAVVERVRLTRADLNDLLDLEGYNQEAVRAVLDEYGRGGITDDWDTTDTERAEQENRENPRFNTSGMLSCLEYHGNVQGRLLLEYGFTDIQIPDPLRDYSVQVWIIGRHVIKAQLAPSPRRRHPYFVTSFEKVPGTPVGNGLPDILADIQNVCNATIRALVNNLSIASGPQVMVNVDRLGINEDPNEMYPWKRWMMTSDPVANGTQPPLSFFQPVSNAHELLAVYKEFTNIADELSAIPKYVTGGGAGGAGRTAAGLAMLMGNASKILQTVAANVDRDVISGLLTQLFDMIMLTDETGLLTGQERIRVLGVSVALQKETQRARQLEFLRITQNPVDAQIIGPRGRAEILRSVAETIGLTGSKVVPTDDDLTKLEQQAKLQQEQQAALGAQAQGAGSGGGEQATKDIGPRIQGGVQ